MGQYVLEATEVNMHFGGVRAVDGISFHVEPNEVFGIIGPNGSGKTTLFNVLTGIYVPTSGKYTFHGKDITGQPLYNMTKTGLSRTFQNLRVFRAMTVRDNVLLGENIRIKTNFLDAMFHTPNWRKSEKTAKEKADVVLEQVGLAGMQDELVGSMPYGMQKRVELARAIVSDPQLLLLDEPTAGMNSREADELMDLVKTVKEERGISVILIEHNMKVMMRVSDRIMAMDAGKKIAEGVPSEIQTNERVIRAYLGEG